MNQWQETSVVDPMPSWSRCWLHSPPYTWLFTKPKSGPRAHRDLTSKHIWLENCYWSRNKAGLMGGFFVVQNQTCQLGKNDFRISLCLSSVKYPILKCWRTCMVFPFIKNYVKVHGFQTGDFSGWLVVALVFSSSSGSIIKQTGGENPHAIFGLRSDVNVSMIYSIVYTHGWIYS